MPFSELDTTDLKELMVRIHGGDQHARNDLAARIQDRLERLASRMLRNYPGVGRWEDTHDVLQNAFVRIFRALETVNPENTRALYGLAAENIRRELIDLARHYQGPHGLGANHQSGVIDPHHPVDSPGRHEPAASDPTGDDLDRWRAFHEEVANLPVEEREVFGLAYYQGWTHEQIAALFQRNTRTIGRYWQSACRMLKERLHGQWADPN
jgi:RNA polymerase sigma-70 factor (ECF subfamily)